MQAVPTKQAVQFVRSESPPYVTPATDIELCTDDSDTISSDGDWEPLWATHESIDTVLSGIESGRIATESIRFNSDLTQLYLQCLIRKDIGPRLLYDPDMNKSRLVALTTAGYTEVEDLLGMSDAMDVSKQTDIPRRVISQIATRYLDGFASASVHSHTDTQFTTSITPRDNFDGWNLVHHSPRRVRWASNGYFTVTVTDSPTTGSMITHNAPNADKHPFYRKGFDVDLPPQADSSKSEAIAQAHEWLGDNQLRFTDDLAQIKHIGPATKDYLELEYDISSRTELGQLATTEPTQFEAIFGDKQTESIRNELPDIERPD